MNCWIYGEREFFCQGIMVDRLAELEDKIEQGKMVELPCKVGDTIYVIRKDGIEEKEVRRFHIGRNGWYAVYYGTTLWDSCDRLGRAWFLTREEAEKRLLELQGDKE
jgi:hypothetical protein